MRGRRDLPRGIVFSGLLLSQHEQIVSFAPDCQTEIGAQRVREGVVAACVEDTADACVGQCGGDAQFDFDVRVTVGFGDGFVERRLGEVELAGAPVRRRVSYRRAGGRGLRRRR